MSATQHAIILAAGRGSRMGALTNQQPKCFTWLGGRRLLDWQLAALNGAGVENIALVTGYLADRLPTLQAAFHNARWAETNMVMSLYCARDWLGHHPCIVSYADLVYGQKTIRLLTEAAGDIVISYDPAWLQLWSRRFADPLSDAESFRIDRQGHLLAIGERCTELAGIQGQYMGLLRFTPAGWQSVEGILDMLSPAERDRLDMTTLLQRLIDRDVIIQTVPIDEPWYEVDSAQDVAEYESHWVAPDVGG